MATGLTNTQLPPPSTPSHTSVNTTVHIPQVTAATAASSTVGPTLISRTSSKTLLPTTTEDIKPQRKIVPPQLTIDEPKPDSVYNFQSRTNSRDNVFDTKTMSQQEAKHTARLSSQDSLENNSPPKKLTRSPSQLSCESSGDEVRADGSRRGRRRSIVRQQSYEEEVVDAHSSSFLSLWGAGGAGALPLRRHSAQGPARREEALEAARKCRDSLDVPTRSQRHHSCDYDLQNSNLIVARYEPLTNSSIKK